MSLQEVKPAQQTRNVFTEVSTRDSNSTPSTMGSSNLRGASAPTDPPVDPAKSRVEVTQAGCPATPSRRPFPYIKAPGRRFTTVVVNTPEQRLGRSFHCYEMYDARVAAELIADAYERGKQDGRDLSAQKLISLRRRLKGAKLLLEAAASAPLRYVVRGNDDDPRGKGNQIFSAHAIAKDARDAARVLAEANPGWRVWWEDLLSNGMLSEQVKPEVDHA